MGFSRQESWSGVPLGCFYVPAIVNSAAVNTGVKVKVTQLCPTLSDPMDCSLPGSSVHGIFQARVLEWGAIAFSVYVSSVQLLSHVRLLATP